MVEAIKTLFAVFGLSVLVGFGLQVGQHMACRLFPVTGNFELRVRKGRQ